MTKSEQLIDAFYNLKYINNVGESHEHRSRFIMNENGIKSFSPELFRFLLCGTDAVGSSASKKKLLRLNINIDDLLVTRAIELKQSTKPLLEIRSQFKELCEHLKTSSTFCIPHPISKFDHPDLVIVHKNKMLLWECKTSQDSSFHTGHNIPHPSNTDIYEFTSSKHNRTVLMLGSHLINDNEFIQLHCHKKEFAALVDKHNEGSNKSNWKRRTRFVPEMKSIDIIKEHDDNNWKADITKALKDFFD